MTAAKVILRKKRADILEAYRHPWVFSKGLVEKPDYPAGTQVRVVSQDGRHLGHAFYHPVNPIALRMISHGMDPMDRAAWRARLAAAYARRKALLPDAEAYRLIHGENDGFPGLTVDVYGPLLVWQNASAGFELLQDDLVRLLCEITGAEAVYARGDTHARRLEGLDPVHGFIKGELPLPLTVHDNGFRFQVDPAGDQKTGIYLDQRPARAWVEAHAGGLRIADLCCYTGGFSLPALRGGAASVTALDSSARALEQLRANLAANGLDEARCTLLKEDVFSYLKTPPEQPFDLVILDPPSLAKSVKAAEKARNGYRRLNQAAAAWVKPGGMLLTFSCTGVVNTEVFGRSVFLGLHDARREAVVVGRFGPGPDHPENLTFPEGAYLKGMLLQVL